MPNRPPRTTRALGLSPGTFLLLSPAVSENRRVRRSTAGAHGPRGPCSSGPGGPRGRLHGAGDAVCVRQRETRCRAQAQGRRARPPCHPGDGSDGSDGSDGLPSGAFRLRPWTDGRVAVPFRRVCLLRLSFSTSPDCHVGSTLAVPRSRPSETAISAQVFKRFFISVSVSPSFSRSPLLPALDRGRAAGLPPPSPTRPPSFTPLVPPPAHVGTDPGLAGESSCTGFGTARGPQSLLSASALYPTRQFSSHCGTSPVRLCAQSIQCENPARITGWFLDKSSNCSFIYKRVSNTTLFFFI